VNHDRASTPAALSNEVTILRAVSRHRWLVAAVAVVTAVAGGLVASRTTGSYTSSAGMVLQDPASILLDRPAAAGDERRYIASQTAIINSQSVAEAARSILASSSDPIIVSSDQIRQATSVSSSTESNFVEVSVQASTPREAQATVDAVVSAYRAQLLANQTSTVEAALARLDERIAAALADFNEAVQSDDLAAASEKRITELSAELVALSTSGLPPGEQALRAATIDTEIQAWLHLGQARREDPNSAARQIEIEQSLKLLEDLRSQRNSLESRSAVIGDGVVLSSSAAKALESGVAPRTAMIISLFLGLVLGIGLAYWLDTRRRSVIEWCGRACRPAPDDGVGTRRVVPVPGERPRDRWETTPGTRMDLGVRRNPVRRRRNDDRCERCAVGGNSGTSRRRRRRRRCPRCAEQSVVVHRWAAFGNTRRPVAGRGFERTRWLETCGGIFRRRLAHRGGTRRAGRRLLPRVPARSRRSSVRSARGQV
jgi:uncharacterized protein involved in exopolysaccharide biosynthesis